MLLTIGIPVYNGATSIQETLESILQSRFDRSLVEVIVSDNNSGDNTCEIVKRFPDVKLYQHSENVGFDGNVDRIFRYASGRYVWTIGADDLLIQPDINEILEAVMEGKAGVIFVGGNDEKRGVTIDGAEEFLIKTNFRSGFVSNNIIRKDLWESIDRNEFLRSAWIHFAMVLKIIRISPSFLSAHNYIDEQEIPMAKTWNYKGTGILTSLKLVDIFERMETWGYSVAYVKRAKMVIKGAYPRVLVQARIEGLKSDWSLIKRFIRYYYYFPTFWLVDIWALIIPAYIFRCCFKIYKFFKS